MQSILIHERRRRAGVISLKVTLKAQLHFEPSITPTEVAGCWTDRTSTAEGSRVIAEVIACFEATPPREKRPARTEAELSGRQNCDVSGMFSGQNDVSERRAAVWFCNPDLPRYVTRSYVAAQPLFSPQPRMSNWDEDDEIHRVVWTATAERAQ